MGVASDNRVPLDDNTKVLSDEQLNQLKTLQKEIPGLRRFIAKMEKAGMNVDRERETLDRQEAQLNALLSVFGD